MPVTLLDGIVLAVVVIISAILAMVRGFVREVLSVASWAAAAAAAYVLHKPLIPFVSGYITNKPAATVVAAAVVFFIALIIASYVTMKISDFIIDSRIGFVDRSMGLVFGAVRGLVIIAVAYKLFAGLVNPLPPWVQSARAQPLLESVGLKISQALPPDLEGVLVRKIRGAGGDDEEKAAEPTTRGNSTTERGAMDNLIRNTTGGGAPAATGGATAPRPATRPSTTNNTNNNTR